MLEGNEEIIVEKERNSNIQHLQDAGKSPQCYDHKETKVPGFRFYQPFERQSDKNDTYQNVLFSVKVDSIKVPLMDTMKKQQHIYLWKAKRDENLGLIRRNLPTSSPN
ncbi:hypothetical protein ACTXT7_008402 [Hymenolepis weldensis]